MATSESLYPLERTTKVQLRALCQVLWSWHDCDDCCNNNPCASEECPFKRMNRLGRFFEYYKEVTASYESQHKADDAAALRGHDDLLRILHFLRTEPDLTRENLQDRLFAGPQGQNEDRAIDMAVKVMVMVNCSADRHWTFGLRDKVVWRNDVSFTQFISDIFPTPTDHPRINGDDLEKGVDIKGTLLAKKLKKHARLTFKPTDDLRSHLRLDKKSGILELYHHTAFLKEHLMLTKDVGNKSLEKCLQLGALPRQLVLEILDSLHILFPITDKKSFAILHSLTVTQDFDPDCLRFESASLRNDDEKDIPYYYFGTRLASLYEELENPTPRGFEKWFQRKSGARYIMMATLVGVVIAIVLGVASLAVSGYQAWLGYQQWQHPISSRTL